ncbi:MAG: MnmC family methyltransferase [bacterium]
MINFYPVKTEDGTLSLFNTEVNDIYHSKIGAYTEALNKFVKPSGILEYVKTNNEVNILDVCFGLGYNSKVAITKIWEVNPNCKINLTGIEIDPYVLACSCVADFPEVNELCKKDFISAISSIINVDLFIKAFLKHVNFEDKRIIAERSKIEFLHNIYYQSLSVREKIVQAAQNKSDLLDIIIYICDAEDIIKDLNPYYHYIFHDPFAPSKAPNLWTIEFFSELYRLLNNNGNITTYSSASIVKSGLIKAGFHIEKTQPIGRKSPGTIAYKTIRLYSS